MALKHRTGFGYVNEHWDRNTRETHVLWFPVLIWEICWFLLEMCTGSPDSREKVGNEYGCYKGWLWLVVCALNFVVHAQMMLHLCQGIRWSSGSTIEISFLWMRNKEHTEEFWQICSLLYLQIYKQSTGGGNTRLLQGSNSATLYEIPSASASQIASQMVNTVLPFYLL